MFALAEIWTAEPSLRSPLRWPLDHGARRFQEVKFEIHFLFIVMSRMQMIFRILNWFGQLDGQRECRQTDKLMLSPMKSKGSIFPEFFSAQTLSSWCLAIMEQYFNPLHSTSHLKIRRTYTSSSQSLIRGPSLLPVKVFFLGFLKEDLFYFL